MGVKQKRLLLWTLGLCVLALTAYAAVSFPAGKDAPGVSTSLVRRMDLEDVVTSLGKLEPATYVDVGAQISGQIISLHADLGDVVKKGDLLADIDPRSFDALVEADKATLANLEAILSERKATLVQATRNYKRDAALRRQNAASELDAQSSETAWKVAQAQVAAVEAQIRQAKATLESDELNLSYCKIYAPLGGTVVSLEVKEGQTLNNRQTAPTLMRIAELELMTVWASVSEADINKITPGMDVYFTTIGNPSERHYAKVEKIHPSYTEENDVILYNVTFTVANPKGSFLPAMNTQVFFVLAQAQNVLVLPLEVLPQNLRNAVNAELTVISPQGGHENRKVAFGARTRSYVEVVSGLKEGEIVLNAATRAERDAARMKARFGTPRI